MQARNHVFSRFFTTAFVVVFALMITSLGCNVTFAEENEDTISRSFDVKEGGKLIMDVQSASIEVNAGGGDAVKVNVYRKVRYNDPDKAKEVFEKYKINFDKSGNDVIIDTDYDRDRGLFSGSNRLRVRFVVTVPSKYNLDLKTSGGSIRVGDIEGDVKVKTSGGSLKFASVKGKVRGATSGGSISIDDCDGDVDVKTSGGSIRIGEVGGEVKANTSGGSIKVKEVMGTIDAHTSGGSISVYISKQPKGDCSLKTSGGSISVKLAEGLKMDLDARTSGGNVRCSGFDTDSRGRRNKQKLVTSINGGGPELNLRTSGGGISIKPIN